MEENYKDKQKKYKEMYKTRMSFVWVSKLPQREILGKKVVTNPLQKGRTYRKSEVKDDSNN